MKGISFNVQFSTKIADLERYSNIVASNIMQTIKNGTYLPKAKVKRRKGRVLKNYSIVPIRYTEETLRQNEREMKEKIEKEFKLEDKSTNEKTGEQEKIVPTEKIDEGSTSVEQNKANNNIPEPPKGNIPEPPKGNISPPPKENIPPPPKGNIPEPPKENIPPPPK